MRLSFHGAALGVTGSCHLLEVGERRILVDCGMFQGGRELHEDNAGPFGFDAASIDVLLLTHAHLDHCGRIPLLARRGFRGEIVSTAATRDLARLVLLDSAHLHEEEARRRRRHGREDAEPLYDTLDALDAMGLFGRLADYGRPVALGDGLTATFRDAGHILGSASVLVEAEEAGRRRRILFSGDVGPEERPFLRAPDPPSDVDVLVMETTYGDRDHRPLPDSVDELMREIARAEARGGNVVIPTFALERAQELLFFLRDGAERGVLPDSLRLFLDSPMAISATRLFRRHHAAMRPEVDAMLRRGVDPFAAPNLAMTRDAAESMALNRIRSGAVLMAGSGMCTGGRVRHHLRHNLGRRECSVVFVGFAAEGTLGRRIVDGADVVRILGDEIPVRARICTINGFSAHAGRRELIAWRRRTGAPEVTFLVHGEPKRMAAFAEGLEGGRVETPAPHSVHEI